MTPLALLAVDPLGLGGMVLRGGPGPERDAFVAAAGAVCPLRAVPLHVTPDRLAGAPNLTETLRLGRLATSPGLLQQAEGGMLLLHSAERLAPSTVAAVSACLDRRALAVLALDESLSEGEHVSEALADRLAFTGEPEGEVPDPAALAAARARLGAVEAPAPLVEALCTLAARLGIGSARAPLLAVRAARAAASLAGREVAGAAEAECAARLVLAPRARVLPDAGPQEEAPRPPDEPETRADEASDAELDPAQLGDLLLAAAAAAIPPGLLAMLAAGTMRGRGPAGRSGVRRSGGRGRTVSVRAGDPRRDGRLNLLATLRAAAPWQRARAPDGALRLQIRTSDFRVNRQETRSTTTTIFAVDASGSQALNRLAEAKGAVELILAECYVRRDEVAVVGFRQRGAEVLLPPTRSLVRAKRALAGLPGGGATPLAAGIEAASAIAEGVRRRGGTPAVVVLTDGRANVALDGTPGRAAGERDAQDAAARLRAAQYRTLLLDTSPRPQPAARALAEAMGARYVPLPAAGAQALSRSIRSA